MEFPVKLLWTGGWDSTYRLLELVFKEQRAVEPYYVIDPFRLSTSIELDTQARIKEAIGYRSSGAAQLIADTRIIQLSEIAPNETVTVAYNRLRQSAGIGTQYEWLARLSF